MEPVMLYITTANRQEANMLVHELLGKRLIACANIADHIESFYWWQGEIEQKPESIIVAKTLAAHVDKVVTHVNSLHSYECPCVVCVPIVGGNPAFIDWIGKQTSSA